MLVFGGGGAEGNRSAQGKTPRSTANSKREPAINSTHIRHHNKFPFRNHWLPFPGLSVQTSLTLLFTHRQAI